MVPPVLVEIEDSPSVETTSGAPIVGAFGRCLPSFNRPSRNAISIRNVLRWRISHDWRSLSRLRGLRAFFYVPESYSSVVLTIKIFVACDDFCRKSNPVLLFLRISAPPAVSAVKGFGCGPAFCCTTDFDLQRHLQQF